MPAPATPTWLLLKTGCQQMPASEYENYNRQVEENLGETCVASDVGEPPVARVVRCASKGSYFWFWSKAMCERAEKKVQDIEKGEKSKGA
jgi:hypothetical protein